jgi:mRNA interferase RelE/StbE
MYAVEISDYAKKQVRKLPEKVQDRIIYALDRIKIRPESYLIKLVGESAHKLRMGDYRAIIDLDRQNQLILVNKVGHRKNIYKNL